jgi:hypothetical protein
LLLIATSSRKGATASALRKSYKRLSMWVARYSEVSFLAAVPIWSRYTLLAENTLCTTLPPSQQNLKRIRGVYETGTHSKFFSDLIALSSVGLHVAKGAQLWDAFRSFELRLLDALEASKAEASVM